jgi:hypothetical protein
MNKFGKSGKTGLSSLPFWNIQFWQFQNKSKEWDKLEDLKIQVVLKQEKGIKGIKGQDRRKSMSYPVFMAKPSTHRMHDPGSNVPHIRPKGFTENQMP